MTGEAGSVGDYVYFPRKISHRKPVLGWSLIALGTGFFIAVVLTGVLNNIPGYELGKAGGHFSIPSVFSVIIGYGYLRDRQLAGGLKLKETTLEITKVGIPQLEIPYSVLHSARFATKGNSAAIELVPLNLESFLESIPKNTASIIKNRIRSGFPGIPIFSYQMEDQLGVINAELNRRIMEARTDAISDSSLFPTP
jgi:hypothetical protein